MNKSNLKIAIIGGKGAGKTILSQLLYRLTGKECVLYKTEYELKKELFGRNALDTLSWPDLFALAQYSFSDIIKTETQMETNYISDGSVLQILVKLKLGIEKINQNNKLSQNKKSEIDLMIFSFERIVMEYFKRNYTHHLYIPTTIMNSNLDNTYITDNGEGILFDLLNRWDIDPIFMQGKNLIEGTKNLVSNLNWEVKLSVENSMYLANRDLMRNVSDNLLQSRN